MTKNKGAMTVAEAGRRGGATTAQRRSALAGLIFRREAHGRVQARR